MDKEWIKNLKTGDEVIVCRSGYYGNNKISTVKRITPTGLINVDGDLYNKDGRQRGHFGKWIEEATEEGINKIRQRETISRCFRVMENVKGISYSQAVAILNVLEGEFE